MTNNLLLAVAATALTFALPASSQVAGGTLKPRSGSELSQRIAAANADFPSRLSKALSSESIQSMLRTISETPAAQSGAVTNFDNVSAPCGFTETSPLRGIEQWAAFTAPASGGGAILNSCSEFGITAHSPPNFLAFNNAVPYASGDFAALPELIVFQRADKTSVSLWVSGGGEPGFPMSVVALSPGGVQGVVSTVTTSTWQQVTVTGIGIQAVALVGNPDWLLVDDIEATPVP